MKNRIQRLLFPPIAVWIVLQFIGCSVSGAVVGMIMDEKGTPVFSPYQEIKIEREKYVEVVLMNSDTLFGKFDGIFSLSSETYRKNYEEFKRKFPPPSVAELLPLPGDTIKVVTRLKSDVLWDSSEFYGFDPGVMKLRSIYRGKRISALGIIAIDDLEEIVVHQQQRISSQSLKLWMESYTIPFLSATLIKTDSAFLSIPLNQVKTIKERYSYPRHLVTLGLAGLVLDVVFMTIVRPQLKIF